MSEYEIECSCGVKHKVTLPEPTQPVYRPIWGSTGFISPSSGWQPWHDAIVSATTRSSYEEEVARAIATSRTTALLSAPATINPIVPYISSARAIPLDPTDPGPIPTNSEFRGWSASPEFSALSRFLAWWHALFTRKEKTNGSS